MRLNVLLAAALLLPAAGEPLAAAQGSPLSNIAWQGEGISMSRRQISSNGGAPSDTERSLRLDELVEEALANNRDIRAAQKKYEASHQRPSQVSTLPDPTLSFMSNNVGNPTPLTTLERRRIELDQEKGSLEAQLASLLNRPPDSSFGRPIDTPKTALTVTFSELYERGRTQAPAIGQEQAMIEKNTYALNLARKDYYPDFAVGGGWFSRGGLRDLWSLRFSVKIPLYFWRKQRYAVAESAQTLEQSRRQYESAEQAIQFRIKDDYLVARASERLVDLYSQGIIPQATLALESAMSSYQVGTLDFLSLLTSFQQLLEYELEYYQEFAAFHEALARLEETTASQLLE